MSLKSKSALIAATAAVATLMAGGAALAGDVNITVTGVQARGGDLLIGLQTANQFLKHEGSYGQVIAAPTAGAHVVTLRDVAPGDYSVSVLHDVDGDHDMKMVNGRPAEGWAMVNGQTLRAVPRFDQVKFTVPATGAAAVSVAMQYPPAP